MAKKAKSPEHYDDLKRKSGWYLAAWRDYRGLNQLDLAEAIGTSKSVVSDLENGAINKRNIQTRYNRDWLEKSCEALGVTAGDLIDTNPFTSKPRFEIAKDIVRLDERDQATVATLVKDLLDRAG